MLNKTDAKYFESDILIINPYQVYEGNDPDAENASGTVSILENADPSPAKNSDFSLDFNRKTFEKREKVEFRVKTSMQNPAGNYSLSVRKSEDLPEKKSQTTTSFVKNEHVTTMNPEDELILPELRGEMISGKITSKNNISSVENITVALSIPGKSFVFKTVKTNAAGKFFINIDKPYTESGLVLQVMDESRDFYTITLDSHQNFNHEALTFPANINLKRKLRSEIMARAVASQIENAYYGKKSDSIVKPNNQSLFFDPLGKDYVLDDYTRFPKLEETIVEVVKEMSYTKKDGKYAIHLRDIYKQVNSYEQTLVLVDGLLIQDINELFDYDTRNLYKITVIPGGYYYGATFYDGVVNFVTKNQDFVSKSKGDYLIKPIIERPLADKTYFKQGYSDKAKYDRIPDYRIQLLWLPELDLNAQDNTVSFYTSDIPGKYNIVLEGFTDNGIPVSLKETIEVK
jgi:predicted  nucleic acid-binding Zn-ribbon protein